MSALTVGGLTKHFEHTCALDGVDLRVTEGEARGLLGPNGAGKTTLLRILLGLVAADAGTVELLGRPAHGDGEVGLDGVAGFVEDPGFYPYLSGRANLEILAELDCGASYDRIRGALEQVELTKRADERVSGYSSGMRKRLAIAAALMRAPRLLLMDEPTAGLDPGGVRFIVDLVRRLRSDGVAVLLSSHQIGELEGVCDGFSVLSRGRVVWDGTASQMRAQAPPSAYTMLTSDDARAIELVDRYPAAKAAWNATGELAVQAEEGAMDALVLDLARAGVAIRRLDLSMSPLESMYFALTDPSTEDSRAADQAAGATGR